jgi:hypothetical protein
LSVAWGRSRCWNVERRLRGILGWVKMAIGVWRGEATICRRTKCADIVLDCELQAIKISCERGLEDLHRCVCLGSDSR